MKYDLNKLGDEVYIRISDYTLVAGYIVVEAGKNLKRGKLVSFKQNFKIKYANKKDKINNEVVKLLINVTDKEAILFSKFKKVNFRVNKKSEDIQFMLDELEKKYPETKFSLIKSVQEMEKILNA